MLNKTDTIEFLKTIYPENDRNDLFLTVYTLPNKKSVHVPLSQVEKAQSILENYRLKQNCYYGIGLKNQNLGPLIAGDASSVVAIPGFWADIDIRGPGHKQENLPKTLQDATALAYSIAGFPPSIIVFSGGGIQAYWLFKELWEFDTPEERKQAEALLKGFGDALIQQGALKGHKIDNVFDLARKFRLAGTHNIKNPDKPVMAMIIQSHDDRRYNPGDFEMFVDHGSSIDIEKSSYDRVYSKDCNYEPANFEMIRNSCKFMRHFKDNAAKLSEPEWYDGLTIVSRCIDGMRLAHELSKQYPNYTAEETEKKVNQALSKTGPILCSTIRSRYPTICSECTHDVATPLHLGRIDQHNDRQNSSAETKGKNKKSAVEKILEIVECAEFFMKDSSEEVYVRFEVDKHRETWPVRSIRFKR
jgi:putative DNA primase/helicase